MKRKKNVINEEESKLIISSRLAKSENKCEKEINTLESVENKGKTKQSNPVQKCFCLFKKIFICFDQMTVESM